MTSDIKILIVENDYEYAAGLVDFLNSKGFTAWLSLSAKKTREIIQTNTPDIILMEIELGDSNGIELCSEIRKNAHLKNTIVVFQSVQTDNFIQISAYNAGADDFFAKPVSRHLLLSKLNSYLRRINTLPVVALNGKSGEEKLIIDPEKYLVYKGQKELMLPRKQFEILLLMYRNPRKVFSREDLKNQLWGDPKKVNNRTIDVHIKKLREIIGDRFIKTIKGVGYKLDYQNS